MTTKEAKLLYMKEWYAKNKEKVRGWTARYRANNPAKVRRQRRKYRESNRDYLRKKARERYHTVVKLSEDIKEIRRKSRKTFSYRSCQARCEARARGATGTHTTAQWLARVEFYGWRCFYCGDELTQETLTHDHRIPVSRGGCDFASNLVPSCKACNDFKGTRMPS